MKLTAAKQRDLLPIFHLLNENELPLQGIVEHYQNFIVIKEKTKIIGCAGLEIYDKVALLRSVAVKENKRNQGLGKALTDKILIHAKKRKIKKVFLLTTTAAEFFKKFGFKQIERSNTDAAIQLTAEFSSLCPCSAIVMVKELN